MSGSSLSCLEIGEMWKISFTFSRRFREFEDASNLGEIGEFAKNQGRIGLAQEESGQSVIDSAGLDGITNLCYSTYY